MCSDIENNNFVRRCRPQSVIESRIKARTKYQERPLTTHTQIRQDVLKSLRKDNMYKTPINFKLKIPRHYLTCDEPFNTKHFVWEKRRPRMNRETISIFIVWINKNQLRSQSQWSTKYNFGKEEIIVAIAVSIYWIILTQDQQKKDWIRCQVCQTCLHEICVGSNGRKQFTCGNCLQSKLYHKLHNLELTNSFNNYFF